MDRKPHQDMFVLMKAWSHMNNHALNYQKGNLSPILCSVNLYAFLIMILSFYYMRHVDESKLIVPIGRHILSICNFHIDNPMNNGIDILAEREHDSFNNKSHIYNPDNIHTN